MYTEQVFWTLFPNDESKPWMDFYSWYEAKQYGDEMYGEGNYTIERM